MVYFLIICLAGFVSALLTYLLNEKFELGAVKASIYISSIVALLFYMFPNLTPAIYTANIPAVIFGASFVGMTSKEVLSRYWFVGITGVFFSVIFYNTSNFFNGFGGGLGTTACIAVVLVYGIKTISNKLQKKK